jgi:hypothetical protein
VLAAILCNLGGAQPPAPPPTVRPAFGGGPFRKRYGYDWDVYGDEEDVSVVAKEAREALPGPKSEKAEAAIFKAVQAIRNNAPERIVLDAQRIYERVFLKLRGELRSEVAGIIGQRIEHERLAELWRAEIKRRVQEQEDEEIAIVLLSL